MQGQLWIVAAPSGGGKTSLIAEAVRVLRRAGADVLGCATAAQTSLRASRKRGWTEIGQTQPVRTRSTGKVSSFGAWHGGQ